MSYRNWLKMSTTVAVAAGAGGAAGGSIISLLAKWIAILTGDIAPGPPPSWTSACADIAGACSADCCASCSWADLGVTAAELARALPPGPAAWDLLVTVVQAIRDSDWCITHFLAFLAGLLFWFLLDFCFALRRGWQKALIEGFDVTTSKQVSLGSKYGSVNVPRR